MVGIASPSLVSSDDAGTSPWPSRQRRQKFRPPTGAISART